MNQIKGEPKMKKNYNRNQWGTVFFLEREGFGVAKAE